MQMKIPTIQRHQNPLLQAMLLIKLYSFRIMVPQVGSKWEDIMDSNTTFTQTTAGEDFQLDVITRSADSTTGLVLLEDIDITRNITTNATTTSLSVFSQ